MKNHLVSFFYRAWDSPTITTWGSFLTKSLTIILILPLILRNFEIGDINLWYFTAAILSIQVILDGGFGSAFVRIIAYTKRSEIKDSPNELDVEWDLDRLTRIYSYMKRIYKKLFLISFFLLMTFGTLLLYPKIQLSSSPINGWIIWSVFCLFFPVIIFGNIYVNLLQGLHKIPVLRRWDTLFNIFNISTTLLAIILFKSIYLVIIINIFWLLMTVLRNRILVKKLFLIYVSNDSNRKSQFSDVSKDVFWNAIKSGVGLLMSQGVIQLSGFSLNSSFSENEIATYMLGLSIVTAIRNFAQAPFYSKLPVFASYAGASNYQKLKVESKKSMQLVYLFFLLGFFTLAFFNKELMFIIGSNVSFPNSTLWFLMGMAFLIDRYGAMHLQIYSTSNHIIWHRLNSITGFMMILLTFTLIEYLGLYAFPLSMIFSYTFCYSFFAAKKSYKFMNVNFLSYEKMTFIPAIFILLVYGVFLFAL